MSQMMSRCALFSGCFACLALFAADARALDAGDSSPLPCPAIAPPDPDAIAGVAAKLNGPAIGNPLSGGGVEIIGQWTGTTCGNGADVWGDGNYAYWAHFGTGCVDVLDITDPTNPTFVSSFVPPAPDRFASAQDVKVHNGIGFVAYESDAHNGCGIVDFRDPENPVQLTTVEVSRDGISYRTIHNMFYSDGYLYLANSRTNTFAVVDLTNYDPDNPPAHISEMKWHVRNVGTQFVHDITVQGDRLYASAWSDIVVFDVSNIANEPPVFLGSAPGQSVHAAWATDDGQYVVTTEERSRGGAKLYSLTDNGNGGLDVTLLDEVGEGRRAFSAHNPIIMGNRVYTSWYESGLIIHEIDRDAGQLVEVGRVDPGNSWGVYPLLGLDRIILGGFGEFVMVSAQDSQVQVNPSSFEVTRGVLAGGDLPDLFDSDDMRIEVQARRPSKIAAASVEIEVTGTALVATPPDLTFVTEVASSGDPVRVRIELFNYTTGQWENVHEENGPSEDQEIRVLTVQDAGRFVQNETLEMKARVGFVDLGVTFPAWGGVYDVAHWTMAP